MDLLRHPAMRRRICLAAIGLLGLGACADPQKIDLTPVPPDEVEDCAASAEWLPITPAVGQFKPAPHPISECPFYRGVWQNFLLAMQPDPMTGLPALIKFPTIDTMFKRVTPPGPNRAYLGDIKQAGGRQIVVDRNGNSLYYGIQANQAFADFILANHLDSAKAIQDYPKNQPNLFFPGGLVEFKDAWQIVEGTEAEIAAQTADFVSMKTTVPTLVQDPATHEISENRNAPRPVTVRLLAIHVVYTVPGHPEFVWGSLEHSDGVPDTKATDGHRDVAPIVPEDTNPTATDPNNANDLTVVSAKDHILYQAGTTARDGNKAVEETDLRLDARTQKLTRASGGSAASSIYRMFPASKSNETAPDDAITSLNSNVQALFAAANLPAGDKRGRYRLLGAQWMDKPAYFKRDFPIQNDATSPFVTAPYYDEAGMFHSTPLSLQAFTDAIVKDGSDSEFSILAGEDRMSSTAMESFTQYPGSFNNCFTCHNTQAITAQGIPLLRDQAGIKLLDPGLLNVSHILSQFILEECTAPANVQVDPVRHTRTAVCPAAK
jgi:hypothetical protein